MRQIIEGIKQVPVEKQDYGNIEKVSIGGELAMSELLREMRAIFKESRVEALYGPTEGTIICTSHPIWTREVTEKNVIGRLLDNVGIKIVDKTGEPAPIGIPGEICIGGAGVSRGYLKRPELMAEQFTPEGLGWEAEAKKLEVELKPCQRLCDYSLKF